MAKNKEVVSQTSTMTNLQGFFSKEGSRDLPFNYDNDELFGYDVIGGAPIFNTSISELDNLAFLDMRTFSLGTVVDVKDPNTTNKFFVESKDNSVVDSQDVTSDEWIKIWTIIEALYDRQSNCRTSSATKPGFKNYADQLLADTEDITNPANPNPYYTTNYVKGSINISEVIFNRSNRLSDVSFSASIDGIICSFRIAYDPDAYMNKFAGLSLLGYNLIDPNNDNIITSQESLSSIVEFSKLSVAKKVNISVDPATATYKEYSDDGLTFLRNQMFGIWSNRSSNDTLTTGNKNDAVREYLLYKYDNDYALLQRKYPELFVQSLVDIFPAYNNFITINGVQYITQTLDASTIKTILESHNYSFSPTDSNFRMWETHTIGSAYPQDDATANRHTIYGIVSVINSDGGKIDYPLKNLFHDYRSKDFDNSLPSQDPAMTKSDLFQYNLMRSILFIKDDLTWENLITPYPELVWTKEDNQWVSFNMDNVTFTIYWDI